MTTGLAVAQSHCPLCKARLPGSPLTASLNKGAPLGSSLPFNFRQGSRPTHLVCQFLASEPDLAPVRPWAQTGSNDHVQALTVKSPGAGQIPTRSRPAKTRTLLPIIENEFCGHADVRDSRQPRPELVQMQRSAVSRYISSPVSTESRQPKAAPSINADATFRNLSTLVIEADPEGHGLKVQ